MVDLWTVSYVVLWALVLAQTVVLLILLRTFGHFFLGTREAISRDGLRIGEVAPDFEGQLVDGRAVRSNDWRGQWLALVNAAPACEACHDILPGLADLQAELGNAAQILVLVSGSLEDVRAVQALRQSPLDIVAIGRSGTPERYRVRVVPFGHVLDPHGVVRAKGLINDRTNVEHLLLAAHKMSPKSYNS